MKNLSAVDDNKDIVTKEYADSNFSEIRAGVEMLGEVVETTFPTLFYFAPEWEETGTYTLGDKVWYEGLIYNCTASSATVGSFIDSEWEVVTDTVYNEVVNSIDAKQDTLVSGTNIKTINNQSLLGSGNINVSSVGCKTFYGTTDSSAAIKPVTCANFALETGVHINVYFEEVSSYGTDTTHLNVNSTGDKKIYIPDDSGGWYTEGLPKERLFADEVIEFVYHDNGYWALNKGLATTQRYGITKLTSSTSSTSTSLAATAYGVKKAYDLANGKLSSSDVVDNLTSTSTAAPLSANQGKILKDTIDGFTSEPIGSIKLYAGSTAPSEWLFCDGSAVSRTTYADLFDVIGTTYGSGDGSTTFNLPNLKGNVPVGLNSSDSSFDTLGETGGEKTHTLIVNEIPSHNHQSPKNGYFVEDGGSGNNMYTQSGGSFATKSSMDSYTQNTGGGQAHNNLQPYIVLNYIIKATGTSPVVQGVRGGSSIDVQVNGTSIVDNGVANIITKSPYDSSTNTVATEVDLDEKQDKLTQSVWRYVIPGVVYDHVSGFVEDAIVNIYSDAASQYNVETLISTISSQETLYLNNTNYPITKMVLGESGDESYIAVNNLDFGEEGQSQLGIKRVDTTKPCFGIILTHEEESPSGYVLIVLSTEEIRQVPWAFVKETDIEYVAPVAITGNYNDLINKPSSEIIVDDYESLLPHLSEYSTAYVKNASLYDITSLSSYNYDNTQMDYISPFAEPDFSTFVDNQTSSFTLTYRDILNNDLLASATTIVTGDWLLVISYPVLGGGYIYCQNEVDTQDLKLSSGWNYLQENVGVSVPIDFNDIPLVPIKLMTAGTSIGNVYNADYMFCVCSKHFAGEYRLVGGEWQYQQTIITPFIDNNLTTVPSSKLIYDVVTKNSNAIAQIQQAINS